MMSLRKTVHTLLGFPDPEDCRWAPCRCPGIPAPDARGLRLIAGDPPRPPHVVESSAVGPLERPPEKTADPGAWGLHEVEDHGGLGLCTESLGFESCDDRVAEEALPLASVAADEDEIALARDSARRERERERARARAWRVRRRTEGSQRFPPLLPWLAAGRRSCFLKGVRKDGRLQLTAITIERPEVFRASRQDGRLRLQLVRADPEEIPAEEEEAEESHAEVEEEGEEVREEREEERRWELRRLRGEGGGCKEAVVGDGIMHWRSHRFVTTA